MIFGGLVLIASSGMLLYNLYKTHFGNEIFSGKIEYAEPIHPVKDLPAYLNGFGLWNVIIAIFMLIAFGYPILQFFLMETFGSGRWGV
jgi:cytochrome c oxidase subunit 1